MVQLRKEVSEIYKKLKAGKTVKDYGTKPDGTKKNPFTEEQVPLSPKAESQPPWPPPPLSPPTN